MPKIFSKTQPLEVSRYVQRLHASEGYDNPFSFGGGKRNGGISDSLMSRLRPLFSFDYMGSAEYEFGAAATALERIAKARRGVYTAWSFEPVLTEVKGLDVPAISPAVIYVIAPVAYREEIERRITGWANVYWNDDLKESASLGQALRPANKWHAQNRGWLELNNGFFFFLDATMFEGTAELFKIKIEKPNVTK
jgi:hypothetical protein